MSIEKTDILIVGGGPAGIQASRMIRTLASDLRVIVLRPERHSVIYCAIPYAIEGLIEMSTINKRDELVTDVGAELRRLKATSADLDAHTVTTEDGHTIQYDKLLIVTGAIPFIPGVPGSELDNIVTVKTADDARWIAQAASRAARAVVVGAGAIGIEQAQALRCHGLEVDLVDMADYPLPAMLDNEYGQQVADRITQMGIRWHGRSPLARFEGDRAVSGVRLEDGTSIKLEEGRDFVVVCVGVRPELGPFEKTDLKRGKDGLVVDAAMHTSHLDVYAAGDCVQYSSGIDGKPLSGKLATNAVPMAKVAARSILGMDASYPGFFNGAATCACEWRVGGTGFTEAVAHRRGFRTIAGRGETTSRFPIMPGAKKVQVKIVADAATRRVIGGQVVAAEAVAERIDVITLAIQSGLTVDDLAQLSYSAQPWQTFFPARNAIVQAAEDAQKTSPR